MKTKNYTLYFTFYYYLWDLALPLHIEIETLHRDYIEIRLHILCFNFEFVAISHKYSKKLDNFKKENKNAK